MKKLLSLLVLVLLIVPSMVFAEDGPNILKGNITVKRTCYQNIHEQYDFYSILQITDVTYNSDGKVDKFNFYALNDSVTSILANVKDSNGNPAFYIAPIDGPGPIYVRVLSTDFDPVALAQEFINKRAFSSAHRYRAEAETLEANIPFGYVVIQSEFSTTPGLVLFTEDMVYEPKYVATTIESYIDEDYEGTNEYQAEINEEVTQSVVISNLKNKTNEKVQLYLMGQKLVNNDVKAYLVKEDGTKTLLDKENYYCDIEAESEQSDIIRLNFRKDFNTTLDETDKILVKYKTLLVSDTRSGGVQATLCPGGTETYQTLFTYVYYNVQWFAIFNEEMNYVNYSGSFKILDKNNNDITKRIVGSDLLEFTGDNLMIEGLKPGKYVLKTVVNNSGYNIPEYINFEVPKKTSSQTKIDLTRSGNIYLPTTGGTGTTLLITLGTTFTLLAIVLLITKYKFAKEN